jgi:hypothetical protein
MFPNKPGSLPLKDGSIISPGCLIETALPFVNSLDLVVEDKGSGTVHPLQAVNREGVRIAFFIASHKMPPLQKGLIIE